MTEENPLDLELHTKIKLASANALFDNPLDKRDKNTIRNYLHGKKKKEKKKE